MVQDPKRWLDAGRIVVGEDIVVYMNDLRIDLDVHCVEVGERCKLSVTTPGSSFGHGLAILLEGSIELCGSDVFDRTINGPSGLTLGVLTSTTALVEADVVLVVILVLHHVNDGVLAAFGGFCLLVSEQLVAQGIEEAVPYVICQSQCFRERLRLPRRRGMFIPSPLMGAA